MAEGVASSLCEAQLADEGSSAAAGSGTVFTGGGEAERRCCCHCSCSGGVPRKEGNTFPNELVVKVRVSDSPERHFVLVDLPTSDLSWLRLVAASCAALGIPVKMVKEVLKLPNTLLVRDKDVKRLLDYQELELILHNA
ncbi:Ankyrin repeat domain-containing protein 40 [Amphibalanus amphitrite]|uniref:Ankyrin repeat domain-containing protein 40 n=1 Tax=Amphibalanus amphitrite TaxID=1232801 RepID=A0A6A4V6P9_AMPAM|nr:Ankyrin repeat domain-containing protein 40 [Amphibalanus amphitrite]